MGLECQGVFYLGCCGWCIVAECFLVTQVFGLVLFLVRDLQVFGEALVSPRLEILQAVIRKMWAQASLADIQPVRCCNRTVATGPRGLDQRAWTNGVFRWSIFFLVVYFMYLLCL